MAQETKDVVRLAPHVYEQLEKSLPAPSCSADATPQQVGYLLGVQAVLLKLRQGFVVR